MDFEYTTSPCIKKVSWAKAHWQRNSSQLTWLMDFGIYIVVYHVWLKEKITWMHKLNNGDNSFFKLSRIKPKIFSTQAVNCCLNSIAGYLASTCEMPLSNPPIYLRGDFSPWQGKQATIIDLMQNYSTCTKVKRDKEAEPHIFCKNNFKALKIKIKTLQKFTVKSAQLAKLIER